MRRNRGITNYGASPSGAAGAPAAPAAWGAHATAPVEDGPLTRIRRMLPSLTGTGRACADYVLANAWEVRGLPIADVAARAGVSPNAVNRFSRAIGYEGYRAFSQALTLELGKILGAAYALPASVTDLPGPDRTDGAATDAAALAGGAGVVLRRVFELEIEALRDTLATLDRAAERAVEALAEAQQVLFIGTGAAAALSELAAYRLKVLGIRAAWAADPGAIAPEIHLLAAGDVVCAISYHGATRHILESIDHARDRGLTTIGITAVPGSPIARRVDIRLVAFGQQTALGFGQFASRVASLTLLDALAAAVAWRRGDAAVTHATELVGTMQRRAELRGARAVRPTGTGKRNK